VIGKLDFDLIWPDMEHRSVGYDIIDPIALACRAGIDLMVRHTSRWPVPLFPLRGLVWKIESRSRVRESEGSTPCPSRHARQATESGSILSNA
jgi:hypothetical protein